MRHLKLARWVAVLTLAIALAPRTASAQAADTLSISGTFYIDAPWGALGADLDEVAANGNAHAWVITLYGVTYSHSYEVDPYTSEVRWATYVGATSFDFEFFGPDADVLNEVVSLPGGVDLALWNVEGYDSHSDAFYVYKYWALLITSPDRDTSVEFLCYGEGSVGGFSTDQSGYPVVEPQRLAAHVTTIRDRRPGNDGGLNSYGDVVDFGSAAPPVLPPPPPPTLIIADGSVREGNKGTTRLELTVTLSRSIKDVVTVNYATANGTALATSDYTATKGTLTFQPGQTSRTIAISIITDRKREKNETFSVKLSNAVGATINDGTATATILNDD
jgi:hypothetical protein